MELQPLSSAVAHRSRDMVDIEAILDAQPKLNVRRIRRWLKEFSTVLESPEILEDFNMLVAQQRKRKTPRSGP